MTDLLLSELLCLLLLAPTLVRPFSKRIRKVQAVPILPFLSLFVCICTLLGQGIVLYLVILLFFTLIVCLSEVIRLIAFFQDVLNDFYGVASIMLRIVLLTLLCALTYYAFKYAPEAQIQTEHQLIVSSIDIQGQVPAHRTRTLSARGLLVEREGGADKKTLVITAEVFPSSSHSETLACLLADQGYTVVQFSLCRNRPIIPRIELYRKLLPLTGKKKERYLAKENGKEITAVFTSFLEKTIARYGSNKRIFLYVEGIYTDLAAQFCSTYPGVFTGVFFCLSDKEPLPQAPQGWVQIVKEGESSNTGAVSTAPTMTAVSGKSIESPISVKTSSSSNVIDEKTILKQDAAPLPFCYYIRPDKELAGFGQLRADDILAAELLGSGRSIGRKDKTAAAAAFQRYALLF